MTSPAPIDPHDTLRDDLAVVEIDGDLVVYDPVHLESHVLSGGAVIVWVELDGQTVDGLTERVAARVGLAVDDLAAEVESVVAQFSALRLLSSSTTPEENHRGTANTPDPGPRYLIDPPAP
jgi:septum formation inhibitor MinC